MQPLQDCFWKKYINSEIYTYLLLFSCLDLWLCPVICIRTMIAIIEDCLEWGLLFALWLWTWHIWKDEIRPSFQPEVLPRSAVDRLDCKSSTFFSRGQRPFETKFWWRRLRHWRQHSIGNSRSRYDEQLPSAFDTFSFSTKWGSWSERSTEWKA